jgi:hypothetical protein
LALAWLTGDGNRPCEKLFRTSVDLMPQNLNQLPSHIKTIKADLSDQKKPGDLLLILIL